MFVCCLTTHQPLWVISVRRYSTKHDVDGKSKNLYDKIKGMMMMSLYNGCNTIVDSRDHVQYLTVSKSYLDNCTCSLTEHNTTLKNLYYGLIQM